VPDAMVVLANAQSESGDTVGARRTLEELIAKHPLTDAAEKARQRLVRLK
jgi:TolA-binding protein